MDKATGYLFDNKRRGTFNEGPLPVSPTLEAAMGTGGGNIPIVVQEMEQVKVYDARGNGDGKTTNAIVGGHEDRVTDYTTLIIEHFNCVIKEDELEREYIVRRLTPTECARLQGFPDTWGVPDHKDDFTDEEYHFWLEVRNTHAAINGRQTKEYTKEQMLKWYNKLHTDSAEYKMWGNGIALPCALYVMEGILEAAKETDK